MNEFNKTFEVTEAIKPEAENFKAIKPESNMSVKEAKSFVDGLFEDKTEQSDGFFSTYEDRVKIISDWIQVKLDSGGYYEGDFAESKFIPSEKTETGRAAKEKLEEYGMAGIEYKNAEADFSKCSEATMMIDNMTTNRLDYYDTNGDRQQGNFTQADIKCAEMWNATEKDGKTDWTSRDVKEWRQENKCSWHECCDTKTMQLVPQEIHSYFSHSGGVYECKIRDNNSGGGLDE